MRQHGVSKRRTWRRIHLAVDSESGAIQGVELTEAGVHEAKIVQLMLRELERPLASAAGDGSYDFWAFVERSFTGNPADSGPHSLSGIEHDDPSGNARQLFGDLRWA